MGALVQLSRAIDGVAGLLGRWVSWLVVVAILVSAGNAIVRKLWDTSSNAWLELQWLLFGAVFLLAAPWTLARNEHIRIDVVHSRFPPWLRSAVELVGHSLVPDPGRGGAGGHLLAVLPGLRAAPVGFGYGRWKLRLGEAARRARPPPGARRAVGQRRRAAAVAGQAAHPARLRALLLQAVSGLCKRVAILGGALEEPHSGGHPAQALPDAALELGSAPDGGGPPQRPRATDLAREDPRRLSGPSCGRGTMAALIAQNLAPIMFAALVALLLLGYPVAFTLGAVGLAFFVIGVELAPYSSGTINLSWPLLQSLPDRVLGIMANETLLAIPFFTFMGLMLERSGMAEDLLETVGQLFGTARGGLAYAVIFVGALLAATTGVVAASVIAMGLISLPIMLRYGYDRRLASGVIAASGTLAQIIPPSLVLIVLADQLGRSVGAMYAGAFLPGLLLALLYAGYVFASSRTLPRRRHLVCRPRRSAFGKRVARGLGSLALLAAASALASWWLMRGSPMPAPIA